MTSRIFTRGLHVAPTLPKQALYQTSGIQGLMSKDQFNLAWTDYQSFLAKNLSLKTVGTKFETMAPLAIVRSTASKQHSAPLFFYASQAHNNHMFFEQLAPPSEASLTKIKPSLLSRIENNFESLESFKNDILFAADSLQGNGWVFLVETSDKELKVVTCHNEGTPYFFYRNQSQDLNGAIDFSDYEQLIGSKQKVLEHARDYTLPILAINVWETAYINDYGVTGKADYLENLWDCINWNVVNARILGK